MMPMTFGPGMSIAMPDVCLTPPVGAPIPYPNFGANAIAVPGYFTIMILGMPEMNMASMYVITNGDQAGSMGGVASGTICGPGRPLMGSMVYNVGGMPSWRITAPTLHNVTNAPGFSSVPSQTIKLVLS